MPRLALRGLTALPAADDQALRRLLLVARLDAFLLAPRAHHVPAAACAAAMRVVHRVHHFAAHLRAATRPARRAGLARRLQLVLGVADLTDRRQAVAVHEAHFGGGHAQRHVFAFLRDDLHRRPGRARHLAAL